MAKFVVHLFFVTILLASNSLLSQSFMWTKTNTPSSLSNYNFYYKQFYEGKDGRLYAAAFGDPQTTFFTSIDHGANWENIKVPIKFNGLLSVIVTDENTILIGTEMFGLFRSTNGGLDWEKVMVYPSRISCFTKDKNGVVYAGTLPGEGGSVYSSTDDGRTWSIKGKGLYNEYIQDITIAENGYFYVATYTGVYISKDNGENWLKKIIKGNDCHSVISMKNGRVLVGCYSGDIFYSDDFGDSWNKSLFDKYTKWVHQFAKDKNNNLYAATGVIESTKRSGGLYRSIDDGNTWQRIGFADSLVLAISHISENRLLLGTYKGIYYSNDLSKLNMNDKIDFDSYPNPFNRIIHFKIVSKTKSPVEVSIYNLLGQLLLQYQSDKYSISGEHMLTWNAKDHASGVYIVKLSMDDKTVLKKIVLIK